MPPAGSTPRGYTPPPDLGGANIRNPVTFPGPKNIDGVLKKFLGQGKLPRGVVKEIMLERILLVTNFSRNRERCRKLSL